MHKIFILLVAFSATFGQIIITEIMFKPQSPIPEWLEIYNNGDSPVDIDGWTISDGGSPIDIISSSFEIVPGEFVILSDDSAVFTCRTLVMGLPSLNNDGDSLFMQNETEDLIDLAVYTASGSWEYDVSQERVSLTADGSEPTNWVACEDASGSTPCYFIEPVPIDIAIIDISINPQNPVPDESFIVSVNMQNHGTETATGYSLTLKYISDFDTTEFETQSIPDLDADSETDIEFALALYAGEYTLLASVDDTIGVNNELTLDITVDEPASVPNIIISELLFKTSDFEWLELYNPDTVAVDINGWTISDVGNPIEIISSSFIIAPGEFIILGDEEGDFICPSFALSLPSLNDTGDSIFLRNDTGDLIDLAVYTSSDWDYEITTERSSIDADGSNPDNWVECVEPAGSTPCAMNSAWPIDYDLGIVSIETDPFKPTPNEPFDLIVNIENRGILSTSGHTVFLYDDIDGSHSYTIVDTLIGSSSIPELASGATASIEFTLTLNSGMHSFIAALSDTIRTNNEMSFTIQVGLSVIITEIMFHPQSGPEWIEIYNAGEDSIDLQNWTLTDKALGGGTITPESFILQSGDYAILSEYILGGAICENIILVSWGGLNDDEEELYLRNADEALVDLAVYEISGSWLDDFSAERISILADGTNPANWRQSRSLEGSTPCEDNAIWAATSEVTCKIEPNPFDPVKDENAVITIHAPIDATIEIRIYDLRGRLIKDFEARAAAIWDGTDDSNNPVPTGPYVIVAQVETGSKIKHRRFPIAVARGMKK